MKAQWETKWCFPLANGRIFIPEGLVRGLQADSLGPAPLPPHGQAAVWGPMDRLIGGIGGAAQEALPHSLGVLEAREEGAGLVAGPSVAKWWGRRGPVRPAPGRGRPRLCGRCCLVGATHSAGHLLLWVRCYQPFPEQRMGARRLPHASRGSAERSCSQ